MNEIDTAVSSVKTRSAQVRPVSSRLLRTAKVRTDYGPSFGAVEGNLKLAEVLNQSLLTPFSINHALGRAAIQPRHVIPDEQTTVGVPAYFSVSADCLT